ncbi:MAG: hypothetical protein M3P18_04485, partial [Actinomycetota bacterium]|nr:hypothetical protein [Actinomycetota bacterium]
MGEVDGTVELEPARLAGLRKHVDHPLVLEHERIGQVMVAFEHSACRRPDVARRRFGDRDHRPAGGVGVVLDEQEVAAVDLDEKRVCEVAPGGVRQCLHRSLEAAVGRSRAHRDEPLATAPCRAAPGRHPAQRRARHMTHGGG